MCQKTTSHQINCYTEYNPLYKVILCPPRYMKIRKIINQTQAHFAKENIDTSIAMKQHKALVETLQQENIDIILLPPKKEFPEQVFTRDLAFTLDGQIIVGQLEETIRQGEEEILKAWLDEEGIPYKSITAGPIEGGDVLINENQVWVGNSYRTSKEAINQLRKFLPDMEIIMVPFNGDFLHLDCVFNILSSNEGLIYPPAFAKDELFHLKERFNLFEISDKEQFTLGTNVLSLGKKKVLSLPINRQLNNQLHKWGYQVIEIDITEIIKSGGSFRCVTMPLLRERV